MPIRARRFIRKMRGGAQAHLLECDDGRHYVVKFRNNPQHRRILVNEWLAGVFLRYLQIACPDTSMVIFEAGFLEENPEIHIQLGSQRIPPEPGWHFGSAFPGDPNRLAVYDFLPDLLLDKVENARDFLGVLAFDKWMGNADARQAIFYRARIEDGGRELRRNFIASMMDHGYVFDGPHWTFTDSPLQGLYFRTGVYRTVTCFESFQPWLDQIMHFPEEIIDDALKQIPPEWVDGDDAALEKLLHRLLTRRNRVPDLIRGLTTGRINPFPKWR